MNYIYYGNYINNIMIIISTSDMVFKSLIYGSCSRWWSWTDFWRGRATVSSLTTTSNAAGPWPFSIAASSNPSACHGAASSSVRSNFQILSVTQLDQILYEEELILTCITCRDMYYCHVINLTGLHRAMPQGERFNVITMRHHVSAMLPSALAVLWQFYLVLSTVHRHDKHPAYYVVL